MVYDRRDVHMRRQSDDVQANHSAYSHYADGPTTHRTPSVRSLAEIGGHAEVDLVRSRLDSNYTAETRQDANNDEPSQINGDDIMPTAARRNEAAHCQRNFTLVLFQHLLETDFAELVKPMLPTISSLTGAMHSTLAAAVATVRSGVADASIMEASSASSGAISDEYKELQTIIIGTSVLVLLFLVAAIAIYQWSYQLTRGNEQQQSSSTNRRRASHKSIQLRPEGGESAGVQPLSRESRGASRVPRNEEDGQEKRRRPRSLARAESGLRPDSVRANSRSRSVPAAPRLCRRESDEYSAKMRAASPFVSICPPD